MSVPGQRTERTKTRETKGSTMAEPAEDAIFRNLIEAVERLREDLDRVELWSAALGHFHQPVPEYRPSDAHLLPHRSASHPAVSRAEH